MSSTPQDGPRRRRWLWLAAGLVLALGMVWQLFWPEYTPDEDSPGPVGVWKVDGGGAKVFRYDGRYVTLLVVLWHPDTKSFTMSNAGGSPPMVCRGGEILKVQVEGVPLGLLPDREYDEKIFHAKSGDIVVLFSDGVSDHLDPNGEEYGRSRLAQVMRQCCGTSTADIVQEIFADLDRFNTERFDDQTLIVMRLK